MALHASHLLSPHKLAAFGNNGEEVILSQHHRGVKLQSTVARSSPVVSIHDSDKVHKIEPICVVDEEVQRLRTSMVVSTVLVPGSDRKDDELVESILWSAADIQNRVIELGRDISCDFQGLPIAILGVATGSFMFLSDLVRHISEPMVIDFVRVQSYGNAMKSSGVATLSTDCKLELKGLHVIIVEDLIDTGTTLSKLVTHVQSKGAASVSVCTLLDKVSRRVVPLKLGAGGRYYYGYECPDGFVVGYGMDYAERFRGLPYIGILKPNVYL